MAMVEPRESVAQLGLTRRSGAALIGSAVILATVAVLAWSQHRPSPTRSAPAAARPAVAGVVRIEGGPLVLGNGSDIRPLRDARLVVTGTTAAGAPLLRQFRADARGRFRLSLPAGHYTVTAIAFGPATRPLSTQPHAQVTVTRGHPVRIQLTGFVQ